MLVIIILMMIVIAILLLLISLEQGSLSTAVPRRLESRSFSARAARLWVDVLGCACVFVGVAPILLYIYIYIYIDKFDIIFNIEPL